ncbi:MAG: response regulator [Candidatus Electrothrix sp. AW2]|nr:response regulator [Candidatus Electrothrix gigas]
MRKYTILIQSQKTNKRYFVSAVLILFLLSMFFISPGYGIATKDTAGTVQHTKASSTTSKNSTTSVISLSPEENNWLKENPVIRVGAFSLPPYIIQNNHGEVSGYMPNLIRMLAARVRLTPEFIQFDDLSELLKQAEQKNIETTMAMVQTAERSRLFTFSPETMPLSMAIFARTHDQSITNMSSLQGKRIALYHNYSMNALIQRQFPDSLIVMADNAVDMLQLVVRGEADAAIQELHSGRYMLRNYYLNNLEVKAYAQFKELQQLQGSSYLVRRDLPLLQSILDKAYLSLSEGDKQDIWEKWFGDVERFQNSQNPQVTLSPEEEQWLARHPIIPFTFDPAWAPVEFANNNGEPQGISSDYLHRLENVLHVRFKPVLAQSWNQALQFLKENKVLLVPALASTQKRQKDFLFTSSYLSSPVTIFSAANVAYLGNLNALTGKKVAVVNGYAVQEWLLRDHPDFELISANTITQALRMVAQGKAFAFVGGLIPTSYYIGQTGLTQIRVAGETPYTYQLSISVSPKEPILQKILEKGLKTITKPERDAIYHRWISVQYTHSIDFGLFLSLLIGACVLLFLFSFWVWRMMQEVRRRRTTEEALRDKEHLLSDVIQFFPEAVFIVDQKGIVLAWNKAMEEMSGVAAEDMLGKGDFAYAVPFYGVPKPILIDLAGRSVMEAEKGYYNVQRDGDTITAETPAITLQGRSTYLVGTASVLRDSHGNIIAAIESLRDVTADRQAQVALREARDAAEAAAQAKSEFLATMSHEIRTPMNAIINLTRLLLETRLDEQQKKYAEISINSSELLLSLINDILDFSKIEAGKLELDHTAFDLRELLKKISNPMSMKALDKGLYFNVKISPDVHPFLLGDPVRLQQILLNFLNNAIKFTEHGGIDVHITAEKEENDHLLLHINVCDTGIGIPKDRMHRLFQSFSQTDASTSRKYGGSGLGLAICKRLSERMGGETGVVSEQGRGSTFWFTVRIQKTTEQQIISKKTTTRLHDTFPFVPRLLLVEDNKINQYVALSILKKAGLHASVAENGVQALEILREKEYDLVFMDIQMPEMDGFEACRRIRSPKSDVLQHDIPIVAMTADATHEDRKKCLAAGMNDYIPKPVSQERLFSVLQGQLNKLASKRQTRSHKDTPPEEDIDIFQEKPTLQNASDAMTLSEDMIPSHIPIFNRADLVERLGGDDDGVDEFLQEFPLFLSEDIKELQIALNKQDVQGILSSAHKIKGMCANASAERVREIAYTIENAAKQGDIAKAQSLFNCMQQEEKVLYEYLSKREQK